MLFEVQLTVPANTPKTAPSSAVVSLAPGIVSRVGVTFPAGCVGLVHAWVNRAEHRLWPTNEDYTLTADDKSVEWPEDYNLDDIPFEVGIYAYNEDDTYSHTLTFRFAVLSIEEAKTISGWRSILDKFRSYIG